jgi:hypothetical protein
LTTVKCGSFLTRKESVASNARAFAARYETAKFPHGAAGRGLIREDGVYTVSRSPLESLSLGITATREEVITTRLTVFVFKAE